MVEYSEYDVFYDYEVLTNVTTNAMLYPGKKEIVIPYNTHIEARDPQHPVLNVTPEDEANILAHIIKENRSSLARWGIPEENVRLTPHFMEEIIKMDDTIPQNKGTMYGFNSSGYDVAITAYLLNLFDQEQKGDMSPRDVQIDASSVRNFSNEIINHEKRSPWASVRDYGNRTQNQLLFSRFANLMNSPWNIDVQSLNAKMSMTSLSRLAAQGGFKIEVSDKLEDDSAVLNSVEELAELLAYNVNDIFATLWLFEQDPYQTPYSQRNTLIDRYGDNQFRGRNIKRDSTEAKLIENVISPNGALEDDDFVSLAYPVTRGYLPKEMSETFTLADANALYADLEQATKVMKPNAYAKNKDRAMNSFLSDQYNKKRESAPDHIIVTKFFYPSDKHIHQKIIAKDGTFTYAADTYIGFNHIMIDTLDDWAQRKGITDRAIATTLRNEKEDPVASDKAWDRYANKIITEIGQDDTDPLFKWFYYSKDHQKVVAKDRHFMMDLLEHMQNTYDMHPDIYTYYSTYRGENMGLQTSKVDVKAKLPKHLKTGAAVLVAPNVPSYVTMSIGGIHGNLIDLYQYEQDKETADAFNRQRDDVIDFYTDKANQFTVEDYLSVANETTEGEKEKIYALAKHSIDELAPVLARRTKRNGYVLGEPDTLQSAVPYDYTTGSYTKAKFKTPKTTKSMKTYTTTFYDFDVIHMDISSYYPTLISILKTLQTKDGNDLYKGLLEERIELKNSLPGDMATWDDNDYANEAMQVANKLLLNAASGAADASYDNNIRVNNKAYRMRIAGQLILFALCLDIVAEGGIPNSINTDGVYVHNMAVESADGIIQDWASKFKLEADTEFIDLFASKDSNNRIEYYKSDKGESIIASGGTVGNWQGTTLTGNLNKPPIVDRTLTDYLIRHDEPLVTFDETYVRDYITTFIDDYVEKGQDDPKAHEALFNFFQLPLVSNESKNRYVVYQDNKGKWHYFNNINRTFLTTKDTNGQYETYQATMVVINKTAKKDQPEAVAIAEEANIIKKSDYEDEDDVHIKTNKVSGVDTDQWFVIQNQSTAQIDWELVNHLDIDAYVALVQAQWKNWSV